MVVHHEAEASEVLGLLLVLCLQFILLRGLLLARRGVDVAESHHERPRSRLGHLLGYLVMVLLEEGLLVLLLVLDVVVVAVLTLLELGAVRLKVGSVTTLKVGMRITPPLVLAVVIEASELLHNQHKVFII